MKRAEIKVGEVYGVRAGYFDDTAVVVPARVVALDDPAEWPVAGYANMKTRHPGGGVRVQFVKRTRVGSYRSDFHLASKTNDNAGPVTPEFVFHDRRPGCGGSVGKCFVGVWSELEARRETNEVAEREARAESERKADEFAPVLAAYVERLRKIGLPVEAYGDGSGLHGPVTVALYRTGDYKRGHRPVGFGHEARLPVAIFNQLVEIAERHGEKVT